MVVIVHLLVEDESQEDLDDNRPIHMHVRKATLIWKEHGQDQIHMFGEAPMSWYCSLS